MNSFLVTMIGGSAGLVAVLLAVLSGLRIIKVKAKVHKAFGLTVLAVSLLHGLFGLLLYLGVI